MIAIIVPAHNEELVLDACIKSLQAASAHQHLANVAVEILIVLDDCDDASLHVALRHDVLVHTCQHRNVGMTRAAGAEMMLARGATWLAFTDADTVVPYSWLAHQVGFGTDAVCGVVQVSDWSEHSGSVREQYDAHYTPMDGHRHIHGANLGVSADAYVKAGGFRALAAHEDVRLIEDLERTGAVITWTAVNQVTTSARKSCRCREGFGDYLKSLAEPHAMG
ncbi:glycosyltransferase [Pseudomonas huanghezhanensis]|uniref:glycosyltransferase n=1 Tax=Pseudomonas huanghezhanensis TaxID=3002903 RepID=UPI002285CB4A|nr:glycosyltransferase [Pseudomonas sp. BSw22131]